MMAIQEIIDCPENELEGRMVEYIQHHFQELLGNHSELLNRPGGLEKVAELLYRGQLGKRRSFYHAAA